VVWDLLLKADPEGPSLISHAAVRHRFHFALIRYMCLCSTLWSKNMGPLAAARGDGGTPIVSQKEAKKLLAKLE